jgi:VTC domain
VRIEPCNDRFPSRRTDAILRHVANDRTVGVERQEVKYLVDFPVAQQAISLSQGFIEPDSHGPAGHYQIASLYLDDENWSAATESYEGVKDRCKLRLRCYSFAANAPVWAEVKRRSGTTVIKSRARIPRAVAHAICRGENVDPSQSLDPEALEEFLYEQQRRFMMPRLWVRYNRVAYTSVFGDDARLTVDRFVEAQEHNDPAYTIRPDHWLPIEVSPECVLELKYDQSYPGWMQTLVRTVNIQKTSISKYGRGADLHAEEGVRAGGWNFLWTAI